jgi:hypothetical protein
MQGICSAYLQAAQTAGIAPFEKNELSDPLSHERSRAGFPPLQI